MTTDQTARARISGAEHHLRAKKLQTIERIVLHVHQHEPVSAEQLREVAGYSHVHNVREVVRGLCRLGRLCVARALFGDGNKAEMVVFVSFDKRDKYLAEMKAEASRRRKESKAASADRRNQRRTAERQKRAKTIKVKAPRQRKPVGRHNHDRAMVEILARVRRYEQAGEPDVAQGKPALLAGEPDLSRAKVTVLPPMRSRWEVEIPAQGGAFSSLRPGQYAFEASTCAARAAA